MWGSSLSWLPNAAAMVTGVVGGRRDLGPGLDGCGLALETGQDDAFDDLTLEDDEDR